MVHDIFFKVLGSELCGTCIDSSVTDQITPEIAASLYAISKPHDLAHIVSASLRRHKIIIDAEILQKFDKEEILAVYRHEKMSRAFTQISSIFEKGKIPYVPLKGAVIRPFYPAESMRTSCDIDILVRECDIDKAKELLINEGFIFKSKNYHDVSLYSPTGIHLELHFSIKENSD